MTPTTLYRAELDLIRASGMKAFPPRLPEQPIFYPVLTVEYARQIARDWNARDGNTGYVLRFQVNTEFLSRYPVQCVGSRDHLEYWIPAEELEEFNANIITEIEIVEAYTSKG